MIPRGLILNPEYVTNHNTKCEKCGQPAVATHYDEDYQSHEYCQPCYPDIEAETSVIKATINQNLIHLFDIGRDVSKGTPVKVKHLAYGRFYTIVAPEKYRGIAVDKKHLDFDSTAQPSGAEADHDPSST